MFFCQILAAAEVFNAAFGIVRAGVIPTLIQVWHEWARVLEFHDVSQHLPFPLKMFFHICRWLEETLSSSSFLVAWRKCTVSQSCSLFFICGAPLRFLGECAFALLLSMVNICKDCIHLCIIYITKNGQTECRWIDPETIRESNCDLSNFA